MPFELSERQKSVLGALVREYVATAEPVASSELVRKYRLPYSPATVRNELLALDEAGFLIQPHTSAGRIPTDKGYRLYINHLHDGDGSAPTPKNLMSGQAGRAGEKEQLEKARECNDPAEFLKYSSRLLAQLTRKFVVVGFPDEELFYRSGIHEVMQEPEFSDLHLMQEFGALMDTIEDELMGRLDLEALDEPRTFIGTENPIRIARHYGMIVSSLATPFRRESIIALIGPKRMDYEHDIALLRHFRELLNA